VSIALALIVHFDSEINDEIREIVLFHTAGITLLTIVVNGTTIKFLIKLLKLTETSEVKKKMTKNIMK